MAEEDLTARLRATGQSGFRRAMRGAAEDTSRVDRNARRAAGGLRMFGAATTSTARGLRLTAGVAGGAAAAGIITLGVAVKRSVSAFEEKRQIVAQTGAVLKSTGGAANVTEGQIDSLSNRLSRMSGVDDEAIRQGQNMLLTFRDIRNEPGPGNVFAETTRATLDMAAAMGMDMPQAALQIGKALNDPEKGMKRLQRVGVTFTKQQEQQIKQFEKSGDRMSAQRVILRELNKEFGGSARAQMTPLKRLRVSWGNIEEAIGGGVAPVVDTLASKFDKFFVKAEPKIGKFGDRLNEIAGRKDLSLERKFTLSAESARNALRPLTTAVSTFWDANREKIIAGAESAVSSAGARMADAAAAAAPHAAGMFVQAFKGAGPWGQLLTVALVSKKLGVFGTLGRMGCNRFGSSWKACAPGKLAGGVEAASKGGRFATAAAGLGKALSVLAWPVALGLLTKEMVDYFTRDKPPAESGDPEDVQAHGPKAPKDNYWDKTHPQYDPGPTGGGAGITPTPVAPTIGRKSVTPFARQGAGPRGRGGGGALLHVEVPVQLGKRNVGRAMAAIAADDLAGA